MSTKEKDYTRQINIVQDYIGANLDKPLTVQELAKLLNFSVYHFHRIFTQYVGESLAKYVLRRRLEMAAMCLKCDPTVAIVNVAYEVGFNSANVFCRNFKKHFGITAEEYRSKNSQTDSKNSTLKRNHHPSDRVYSHYFCSSKTLIIGDKTMECTFEIKQLPALRVVYCRHNGAYDQVQNAFAKLMQWSYPRGLVTPEAKLLSIYYDNPDVTVSDRLISDACLQVKEPVKVDGEIGYHELQGGQYAVGRFEIAMEEFKDAWNSMFKLIAEHGCQCIGLPFEIYQNNRDEHPEKKFIVDICIPVKPL